MDESPSWLLGIKDPVRFHLPHQPWEILGANGLVSPRGWGGHLQMSAFLLIALARAVPLHPPNLPTFQPLVLLPAPMATPHFPNGRGMVGGLARRGLGDSSRCSICVALGLKLRTPRWCISQATLGGG